MIILVELSTLIYQIIILPILLNLILKTDAPKVHYNANINSFIYSEKNFQKFKSIIEKTNWSSIDKDQLNKLTPNQAYDIFSNKFTAIFDKCFKFSQHKSDNHT